MTPDEAGMTKTQIPEWGDEREQALTVSLLETHRAYLNMRQAMDGSEVTSIMVSEREFRDECAKLFRDHSFDLLIKLAHLPTSARSKALEALGEAAQRNGLAWYNEDGEMRFQPPLDALEDEVAKLRAYAETNYASATRLAKQLAEAERRLAEVQKKLTPTIFWDADDSEVGHGSPYDLVETDLCRGEVQVREIQCAAMLDNFWVVARLDDDDDIVIDEYPTKAEADAAYAALPQPPTDGEPRDG